MAEIFDPFRLIRFVDAQRGVYTQALGELRDGRKQGHWMWFIFPQVAGLGLSLMTQRYAIGSAEEGHAYLAHSLLGPRLMECTQAMLDHAGQSAETILGEIDAIKLRSSMTLFGMLADQPNMFDACRAAFFGEADPATRAFLER